MNRPGQSQCRPVDKTEGRKAGSAPNGRPRPRKLRRGKKATVDPRSRMVEAMLASNGEQGYATTVVADVIAKAVASRKTFYEHFEDKKACFFAMSEEVTGDWVGHVERAEQAREDGVSAIAVLARELCELSLQSPAALRVLAVELTAAGASGIERRERALDELARTLREALGEDSPDTRLLARVIVGAILRVLYARARRGARVRRPRRAELEVLAPQLARWAGCYVSDAPAQLGVPAEAAGESSTAAVGVLGGRAPGTLSLGSRAIERRGLPRGEGNVSRSFVVHNQRERILDALANVSTAKGYGATTIPEIVQEAAVSVQAFYEHFSGKEDAFLVAYEIGHRKALAIVERAFESQRDWPAAVHAGVVALLDFLASEPSYAHVALIDAWTASPKAAEVAHDAVGRYAAMLEPGLGTSANGVPPTAVLPEATTDALFELCFVYVAAGRTRELASLQTLACDLALRPFAGVVAR
jgi:AcrR family transcriptional regulator